MNLIKRSLIDIRDDIATKKVSSTEVVKATFAQIAHTRELNCLISEMEESALIDAKRIDDALARGENVGALGGVPIVVKDNIVTKGTRTTCGSKMLANFVPPYDATVVEKLKRSGAIIVGKANMDEFAMGSSTETSAFGACKNAVAPTRVPGGSSGGSASSVAGFQCYGSLGSDTGGSIRQPASYCGVVGLKPTYSTVSRYGLIAFASSLDQIGTFTRTVKDNALLMNVISGYDSHDSTSYNGDYGDYTDYSTYLGDKKIGVAKEFFGAGLDSEVRFSVEKAISWYESQGAKIVPVSISSFEAALATYYVLSSAEAASNLSRYDGIKYGASSANSQSLIDLYYSTRTENFGDEVKRRIMTGNYVLSSGYYDAYYLKAGKVRTLIKQDFDNAFEKCDALISPTAPTTAFELGRKETDHTKIYLSDIFTVPVNIAGIAAISVPCGCDKNALPIGMQLIGKAYSERTLFGLADAFMERGGN